MSLLPKATSASTLTKVIPPASSLSKTVHAGSGLSSFLHGLSGFLKLDVIARTFRQAFNWWYGYVLSEDLSQVVTEAGEYVVCESEAIFRTSEGATHLTEGVPGASSLAETSEGDSTWLRLS